MKFKDPSLQNSLIHEHWEKFTMGANIEDNEVHPIVLESWKRSRIYGIDPHSRTPTLHLSNSKILARKQSNQSLLDIAKPFMNSIYSIVGNNDFIIRLTDKDGYILDHIGEKGFIARFGKTYLQNGYNLKEEYAGTNAIGLCLLLKKPIQIMGSEHYMMKFHGLTTSACPIKDKFNETIGILSITGNYAMVHPHTLGMVAAAAEAIQRELRLREINLYLNSMNKQFYDTMETISEGIIAVDSTGSILNANKHARDLLHIKRKNIEGTNISSFLKNPKNFERVFTLNDNVFEEEWELITQRGTKKKYIVEVNYFKTGKVPKMIVFIINPAKVIHNMINKIVGANAIFTFEDIVGKSEKLNTALHLAKTSSKIDLTILLHGESGTGKEMFAQSIHNSSARNTKPFVFLNCGAIPRELVASELFGYEEGAFTGARLGGHPGKFELADGGTLFLDEIGDMPLDAQVSLLRVLETKKIVRVGGKEVIPVDVRVIAATHKDLHEEVTLGRFREDLYYRLNVFPIDIPPLRDRKEDIRLFIKYFVNKYGKTIDKDITGIEEEFYRVLQRHNWPGNVRELQNTLQMAVNIAENNTRLSLSHLPKHLLASAHYEKEILENMPSLDEVEKQAIIHTLEKCQYNLSKTADILKIGRSTLYRKMEKYDIEG